MIKVCCEITNKKGEVVKNIYNEIFDNLNHFWFVMNVKYGYSSRDYDFIISGKEI